jgi:hypothetical protein
MPQRTATVLLALTAVVLCLVIGLTASGLPRGWLVLGSGTRASTPRPSAPPSVQEEFLIPLADAEADRYLRTTVVIEFKQARARPRRIARSPAATA